MINKSATHVNLSPNIADPDGFYAKLIGMQVKLSDDDAQGAVSKLVLILANHIGDMDVLFEAIELVKKEYTETADS